MAAPATARDFFGPIHTGPITALQFVRRIMAQCAVPPSVTDLDYVVAGDPTLAVTGIATTAMATLDCLKAAVAANSNLIVTREATFWEGGDDLKRMEGNALFRQKRDFIRAHNLVCFRLHDHWPARGPSGIATGMAKALGWEGYIADPATATAFNLPPTTLLGLAKALHARLGDRTMRMVGDPRLPVRKVATAWGNVDQIPAIHLLNTDADVVICGYTHEWEAVEYAQDMVAVGDKKGLVLLGEVKSTDGGMAYCADWLKTFVTEVPVAHIPVIEPFWNPQDPLFEIDTGL